MIERYTRPEMGRIWELEPLQEIFRCGSPSPCSGPRDHPLEALRLKKATFTVKRILEIEKTVMMWWLYLRGESLDDESFISL